MIWKKLRIFTIGFLRGKSIEVYFCNFFFQSHPKLLNSLVPKLFQVSLHSLGLNKFLGWSVTSSTRISSITHCLSDGLKVTAQDIVYSTLLERTWLNFHSPVYYISKWKF